MFYDQAWDQTWTLVTSPNGGENWYAGADNVYRPSHLHTNNGTNGWVVNNETLMRTTDGGSTFRGKVGRMWKRVRHHIDWIDGNNCWVLCGEHWDTINQLEYLSPSKQDTRWGKSVARR